MILDTTNESKVRTKNKKSCTVFILWSKRFLTYMKDASRNDVNFSNSCNDVGPAVKIGSVEPLYDDSRFL